MNGNVEPKCGMGLEHLMNRIKIIANMVANKKEKKLPIRRRGLPAELISELFACLPLEIAFELFIKMPNGLLAKNVRKMLNHTKMAMNENKWNLEDCSPDLGISGNGLVLTNLGRNFVGNSVRANLPIPKFLKGKKPYIAFYFEVLIFKKAEHNPGIGFSFKHFLFNDQCLENSIIILMWHKEGMRIDGSNVEFKNSNFNGDFNEMDVIGMGLRFSPANSLLQCFATCNGELLGWANLPKKFIRLELFPTVILRSKGDLVRVNFGNDVWQFPLILASMFIEK